MDVDFVTVLRDLNGGETEGDLTNALKNVAAAVKLTQKPGSVTLKIDIKPAEKMDGNVVYVRDSIKVNAPEFDRRAKIFFVDDDNNLVRDDPRQKRFPEMSE